MKLNNAGLIKEIMPNKRKLALNIGLYAAFFVFIITLNATTNTGVFSPNATTTAWITFIIIESFFAFRFVWSILKLHNSKILVFDDRLEVTFAIKTKTAAYHDLSQIRFTTGMAPSLLLRNKFCVIYFKNANKPKLPIQIKYNNYVKLHDELSIVKDVSKIKYEVDGIFKK